MAISKSSLWQRYRRRRAERGSALFITVMVVTLLSAVGVFAMRASSLANMAVGFNRLGVQTQYAADFAARALMADLAGREQTYYESALGIGLDPSQVDDDCRANMRIDLDNVQDAITTCRTWSASDVLMNMEHAANVGAASGLLGTLSRSSVSSGFKAEMTDVHAVEIPIPGHPEESPLKYQRFTLTSTAYIQPQVANPDANNTCSDSITASASMQQVRAQVIFGPVMTGGKTEDEGP